MSKFEEDMKKLEQLAADIKRSDISLEDALKDFEQGIKLSKSLEKELDSIEGKVMKLMNAPAVNEEEHAEAEETDGTETRHKKKSAKPAKDDGPILELFTTSGEINGTRNA